MGGPRTHMTSWSWRILTAAALVVVATAPALAQSDGLRLLEAVKARDAEAVGDLLERQADVNFVQADGASAAVAIIAAFLGAGQSHDIPEDLQKALTGLTEELHLLARGHEVVGIP